MYDVYIVGMVCVHAHLHGVGEHACQSEGDLLRELFPRHGNLKTVSKVNVQDSASQTVQHEVGGVPESDQSEYINHHMLTLGHKFV